MSYSNRSTTRQLRDLTQRLEDQEQAFRSFGIFVTERLEAQQIEIEELTQTIATLHQTIIEAGNRPTDAKND